MHSAKKSLGQNFLVDPNYRRKITESLALAPHDSVLEIGPGRGALTADLARHCARVRLVEKDRFLAEELKKAYAGNPAVEVVSDDFLETDLQALLGAPDASVKAVGNLPYNVASQIFIRLLENRGHFSGLYLMFQKEMALRFTARAGTKDYGLLTIWAGIYTEAKILFHLPPTAFKPAPKVQSSFVKFQIREEPLISDGEAPDFFQLMRELFQKRRKTIRTVLKDFVRIPVEAIDAVIEPKARAEDLSVEELIGLFRRLKAETLRRA